MLKNNRGYIVMLVLLSQTVLSITAGMISLHISSKWHFLPNIYIGSLGVGNSTRSEVLSAVKEHYGKLSEDSSLKIKYGDGKEFNIKLSDIDFSVDCEATADKAYYINGSSRFEGIIKGFFLNKRVTVYPVVSFNEEKLKKHLEELALSVDKAPVNARISIQNGKVHKTPHQLGMKLNLANSAEKIKSEMGSHLEGAIEFNADNNFEINWVWPELTLADFSGVDSVISSYSTPIMNPESGEDIKRAAKALNGFLIMGADKNNGKYKEFSFIKRLREKGIFLEEENEGYSQVASTLYAALLKTGIDMDCIDRKKHDATVDYIGPGLDVKISGNGDDFTFRNSFDFPMAVFTECTDNSITVHIVGRSYGYLEKEIEVKVIKRIDQPVLKVVNYDLKPLEEKVVNSGRQGVEIEVYRVSKEEGERSLELLYTDNYETVGAIVQVGPGS